MIGVAPPGHANRLAQRLEALGLPRLSVTPRGGARVIGVCSWFERTVVAAPRFTRALHGRLAEFGPDGPDRIELLPGVSVLPLRERNPPADPGATRQAVLLLGPELLTGEALRGICDDAELDHAATVARADVTRLFDAAAADRLAMTVRWLAEDAALAAVRNVELTSLSHELATNYEELSLLYKLSCNMTLDQSPAAFFAESCAELQAVGGLGWVALQLVEDEPRLQQMAGRTFASEAPHDTAALRRLGVRLIERHHDDHEPRIDDDPAATLGPLAAAIRGGLLAIPLVRDRRVLGVLFGGDRTDGNPIDSVDAKLCASLGNSLTIFLENLMLFEDARGLFLGTLHALTAAIDAKDSYTHGHSERVALVSMLLARAAGFDEQQTQRVYLAGLVHDVGKIGVPEAVLSKPGRLTEAEFELVKRHPDVGATILRDIRQMDDLIPGVRYHHERWDGRGYPEGRAGEDIPVFGRVIAMADAFDAMSSDRTYRKRMTPDAVRQEVRDGAGTQFDPDLAARFLALDLTPYHEMFRRQRGVA
ncbi:MAG: HD domain-containing phosphohydrolase [Planctomycetota bacterium]